LNNEETAITFFEKLSSLTGGCASDERFILQTVPGDPADARDVAWRPRPWKPGDDLPCSPNRTNGYVAISTFGRAPDNTWRRQKVLFKSGRAIMIDDVGTKVERSRAAMAEPTWIVETSPGNEQWIYLLERGEKRKSMIDALLDALVDEALLPKDEADPGMKGVTRVMRVPGFINGKKKYGGDFRVKWTKTEGPLWTVETLARKYKVELIPRLEYRPPPVSGDAEAIKQRLLDFGRYMRLLKIYGIVPRNAEPNAGGWRQVTCPWYENHTGGKNDGADIREPAPENDYTGSFKCFHGHCEGRGWRQLTDHIDVLAAEDLMDANEAYIRRTESP